MIYTELERGAFARWIKNSGSYSDNFTYEGANALQDYLEELSDNMGENMEFDPIAWCCEYSEYKTALEWAKDHWGENDGVTGNSNLFETEEEALQHLQDNTTVIEFNGGIIVQDF